MGDFYPFFVDFVHLAVELTGTCNGSDGGGECEGVRSRCVKFIFNSVPWCTYICFALCLASLKMIECYTDSLSLFLPLSFSLSLAHLHRTNGRRREEKVQFATHLLQLRSFFLPFFMCRLLHARTSLTRILIGELLHFLLVSLCLGLCLRPLGGDHPAPPGACFTIPHRLDHRLHPGGLDERTTVLGKDDKVGNVLVMRHAEVVNGRERVRYNNTVSAHRRLHELRVTTNMLLL